jgi:hypothetical protein
MAHLTGDRGDRAQILIVSAFALGVLFVALALILNSAIFTENLASRGETTGGENVVTYQRSLEDGVGEVLTYENENITSSLASRATIESRVTTGANDLGRVLTRRSAKDGATSTLTVSGSTDGTLVRQTNNSRSFTDATDADDWLLATGVDNTRAFRLNVTRGKLQPCTRFGDCFNLTVTDGSDEWTMSINDSSGVTVAVEDPAGATAMCDPVPSSNVVVDVTAGTVNGTNCPALNFADAPSTNYAIEYENGTQIGGTYSLVVDNSSLTGLLSYSGDPTTGEPAATPALYDVTVAYDFQSATVNYSSAVRVAPGETDG